MQNSPTAAYLRDLSLHERLMLTSLIKCMKREGIEEIKWSEASFLWFPVEKLTLIRFVGGTSTSHIYQRADFRRRIATQTNTRRA